YVVNFWATWCKPCIEEMPHFLEVASEMKDEKIKFIFVSLDFPTQKESRLLPFLEKHEIREHVILLNDPNSNEWINRVDADWSGAIPATLIYKNDNRSFHESSLSKKELITIIKSK
ncbi:TlpA family protein disulfide reductase, partial [bacterium]